MMLITTEQWLPLWLINQFWVFGWEGSEKLRSSWKLLQFWFFWSSPSRYHGCGRSALLATAEVALLPEMVCFLSSFFFLLTETSAAFHHRGSFVLVLQVVQLPSISCCCLCIALFAAKVSFPNLCARAHVASVILLKWVFGSDNFGVSVLSARCSPFLHPRFVYCFVHRFALSVNRRRHMFADTTVFPVSRSVFEVCATVKWRGSQRTRKGRRGRFVNQYVMHANSYLSLPKLTNHQ